MGGPWNQAHLASNSDNVLLATITIDLLSPRLNFLISFWGLLLFPHSLSMRIKQVNSCKKAYLSAWHIVGTSVSLWWPVWCPENVPSPTYHYRICILYAEANTRVEAKWFQIPQNFINSTYFPTTPIDPYFHDEKHLQLPAACWRGRSTKLCTFSLLSPPLLCIYETCPDEGIRTFKVPR